MFHVKNWVRPTFFISICPIVDTKAKMLIESQGLRVLFVHGHLIDSKVFNSILNECLSDSFPSFLWRNGGISILQSSTPMKPIGSPISLIAMTRCATCDRVSGTNFLISAISSSYRNR